MPEEQQNENQTRDRKLETMQIRLAALVDRLNSEYGDCYAKNSLVRRVIKGQLETFKLIDELLTYDDEKRQNVLDQIDAVRQDLKEMNDSP